jgi:hypothetical protein
VAAQLGTAAIRLAMATVASGPLVVGVLMVVEFVNGVLMPLFNVNLMSLRQASMCRGGPMTSRCQVNQCRPV